MPKATKSQSALLSKAVSDVVQAAESYDFWATFAWNDVKVRYRRSRVGQFWITLSIAVFVIGVGTFYSAVLNAPVQQYLPELACGFIIWTLISTIANEGTQTFIEAAYILQNRKLPLLAFPLRIVARNIMIFFHNALIIAFLWLLFGFGNLLYLPLAFVGLALVAVSGVALALLLGMVSARFRDIPQIIQSVFQFGFFLTPILWQADKVGGGRELVARLNPLTHYLEVIRGPLLGRPAELENWVIAIALTLLLSAITLLFYANYRSRITYWL
jgi:ABC-type polysaccharide/polyol phosphate export permease